MENNSKYDSKPDTVKHIRRVQDHICEFTRRMHERAAVHDSSKLEDPEKFVFDEMTPLLKGSTYGSDEYKGYLKKMKVALDHHYAHNSHHPEHFKNGIDDMTLMDLVEMFCDWLAATERHADGDIMKSIQINRDRFNISPQLTNILANTAETLKPRKRKGTQ